MKSKISNSFEKEQFGKFFKNIELDSQQDLTQAKQAAQNLKNFILQSWSFNHLANNQFEASLKIAKLDPLHDLTEANQAAQNINDPSRRSCAFNRLAEVILPQKGA